MTRPPEVVWRGRVEAVGWVAPDGPVARERALRAWTPGCRVQVGDGAIVVLPAAPERLDRRAGPGEPLVRDRATGALCGVPLEEVVAASDDLVVARAGAAHRIGREDLVHEDPAAWIDLTGWQTEPAVALGPVPARPSVAVSEPARAAEEIFGEAAPEVHPERASMLDKLRRAGADGGGGAGVPAVRAPTAGLLARMQRWLSGVKALSPLWKAIQRRQGDYMRRLLDAFDRGDIEEALRRAIPLGGEGSGETVPAWGTPERRTGALKPSELAMSGIGRAYGFGVDLYDHLERLYRVAAERLEAQGFIDKAAFVLADLLQAPEEAVALLERHGEYELAARIAEGRGLPPERVVRQWFLAGDAERALVIARRHDAFAAAITALAESHPDKADALRLLQARLLAERGDYAAAVTVIWPVQAGRRAARQWIDRGIAAGGTGGARLLVWKVAWFPETLEEEADRVRALLDDDSIAGAPARQAFQGALRVQRMVKQFPDALRPLAAAAARSRLRDDMTIGRIPGTEAVARLLDLAQSPALAADVPNTPRAPSMFALTARSTPLELVVPAGDVGPSTVHDAGLVEGRLLVALGEAGVAVCDRDGRVVWRCPEPAHRLVLPRSGDRVLLLGRRGERLWRVASLDLHRRASRAHRDLQLDAFAQVHQDGKWWVGAGSELSALDPLDVDLRALWRNRNVGGAIEDVCQGLEYVSWIARGEQTTWCRLELGPLQLRARSVLNSVDGVASRVVQRPDDGLAWVVLGEGNVQVRTRSPSAWATLDLDASVATVRVVAHGQDHLVLATGAPGPTSALRLLERRELREVLRLEHRGTAEIGARLQAGYLVVWDDRGRARVLHLHTGAVVVDARA